MHLQCNGITVFRSNTMFITVATSNITMADYKYLVLIFFCMMYYFYCIISSGHQKIPKDLYFKVTEIKIKNGYDKKDKYIKTYA